MVPYYEQTRISLVWPGLEKKACLLEFQSVGGLETAWF